jgi:PAS domain S-box-containing protein
VDKFEPAQRRSAPVSAGESPSQLQKLALVAKYTDNAVIITDPHGRIEWVNEAFTRITGYTFDEVIGRNPGKLLQGPHSNPKTIAFMTERLRLGQGFKTEIVNYSKTHREYLLEIDVQPVHDDAGSLKNFIAIERDVTESSAVLQLALESARQGIWRWEPSSAQVILSAHFLPLFGYTQTASHQIDSKLLAITHADDRAALQAWYMTIIQGKITEGEIEYRIRTSDGPWRWIRTQGKAVNQTGDASGHHILGIHSDITERKRVEAEIHRMAYFDSLTGLANRTLLIDRIEQGDCITRRPDFVQSLAAHRQG